MTLNVSFACKGSSLASSRVTNLGPLHLMTFASPQAVSLPENVDPRRRQACSMDMSLAFKILGQKVWGKPLRMSTAAMLLLCASAAHAQGILTVTPSPTASTLAGTGILGYNGDGGSASSATLAQPGAVAYDKNGNLYLADTNNNVVREITPTGIITTIAGTGTEGFSGDGGAATAAQLDTPTGVAVDASGNVYIADSHNNRIRKVSGGTIATFAGTGTPGFAGDGASASAAQLALPTGVAVDASGNVYIADTNNDRIREVAQGTITTIAGSGEELLAGDGGAATAASLDLPTGVAVDAAGRVYIADRHNQRIRMIDTNGSISTVAGSGAVTFSGGFAGDGSSATTASLAKPAGVAVDSAGTVYVADTNNQRIRQIGNGSIATVAGSGDQGFGGDGGLATTSTLNAPRSIATDASGNIAIADTGNQRLRGAALPVLSFSGTPVGMTSTPQEVTLGNSGTAPLQLEDVTYTGSFASAVIVNGSSVGPSGSCGPLPFTLAPGASCTVSVTFQPVVAGASTGSVVFGSDGVSQTLLLSGNSVQSTPVITLTASGSPNYFGTATAFTAKLTASGSVTPTGTVTFYDGTTLLGTVTLATGNAGLSASTLAVGSHTITAVYSGDANFPAATSSPLTLTIIQVPDFQFGSSGANNHVTVEPGSAGVFTFTLAPQTSGFANPITFSASGLPPGATVAFSPASITPGTSTSTLTMTVQTAAVTARNEHLGKAPISIGFALILLPFATLRRMRRRKIVLPRMLFGVLLLLGLGGAATMLTGCGAGTGFFVTTPKDYTITVTASAVSAIGTQMQHTSTVVLTVE